MFVGLLRDPAERDALLLRGLALPDVDDVYDEDDDAQAGED
jgi:hypothetical protein